MLIFSGRSCLNSEPRWWQGQFWPWPPSTNLDPEIFIFVRVTVLPTRWVPIAVSTYLKFFSLKRYKSPPGHTPMFLYTYHWKALLKGISIQLIKLFLVKGTGYKLHKTSFSACCSEIVLATCNNWGKNLPICWSKCLLAGLGLEAFWLVYLEFPAACNQSLISRYQLFLAKKVFVETCKHSLMLFRVAEPEPPEPAFLHHQQC